MMVARRTAGQIILSRDYDPMCGCRSTARTLRVRGRDSVHAITWISWGDHTLASEELFSQVGMLLESLEFATPEQKQEG